MSFLNLNKSVRAVTTILFLSVSIGASSTAWSIDFSSWFGNEKDEALESSSTMTLDEAKRLIAEGQDLETIPKTHWKQLLDAEQYEILWEKSTERAFTGGLLYENREGVFVSAACKIPVFSSEHKFKSGTGWPSFWNVFDSKNIRLKEDRSWGMRRVEIVSACGEHLGHVFEDGPGPTGLRYCINSKALEFIPKESETAALLKAEPSS